VVHPVRKDTILRKQITRGFRDLPKQDDPSVSIMMGHDSGPLNFPAIRPSTRMVKRRIQNGDEEESYGRQWFIL